MIDRRALGKLRRLSDAEMVLVERIVLTPDNRLSESDVAAVEALFTSEHVEFKSSAELQKRAASETQTRYDRLLDGRDVRDLSDAEFKKGRGDPASLWFEELLMAFDPTQPHMLSAPFRAAAPKGPIMYAYETGDIVTDPIVLTALNALGAPLVNITAGTGV